VSEGPQRPGDEPDDEARVRGLPPEPSEASSGTTVDEPRAGDGSGDDPFVHPSSEDGPATAPDEDVDDFALPEPDDHGSGASEHATTLRREPAEQAPDIAEHATAPADTDPEPAVADASAVPASGPPAAAAPTVVVRRGGGRGIAIVALVLVLLVIGAVGGAAGWFVYRGEDPLDYLPLPTIERLEARIVELEADLADAKRTGRRALDREAELRDGLDELGRALTALSSDIAAEAPIDERQWRLAETAYLLRVANFRAGVENDRAGAEALLIAADELLRELDDLGLSPVRERIAEARTALRTQPAVDRTGLYLELEALGDQIAALPLDQREYVAPPRGEPPPEEQLLEETDELEGGWTGALRETVAGLVDFRVHRPSPVRTLSEPGEADFVRHNLALKLEQAQLALLRKDAEVWRIALEDAARWTRDYFDLEDPAVEAILRDFERLTDERVAVPAPDLSAPHDELMRLRSRASFLGGGRRPAA
jgi:uroporphyrin-3 C-methyltransferase